MPADFFIYYFFFFVITTVMQPIMAIAAAMKTIITPVPILPFSLSAVVSEIDASVPLAVVMSAVPVVSVVPVATVVPVVAVVPLVSGSPDSLIHFA